MKKKKLTFLGYLAGIGVLLMVTVFRTPEFKAFVFSFSPMASFDNINASKDYNFSEQIAIYNNKKIEIPSYLTAQQKEKIKVLGETSGEKRILVDLTQQRLYAIEGDQIVYKFVISSGKWRRTPIGTFNIWSKFRYTKMEGGSKALGTYYYLPNVPYVMFFYNNQIAKYRGFSLHGTYWHTNFGQPMSHGCVNMRTEDAASLYYWANPDLRGGKSILASDDNPGTQIIIYGQPPSTL